MGVISNRHISLMAIIFGQSNRIEKTLQFFGKTNDPSFLETENLGQIAIFAVGATLCRNNSLFIGDRKSS